MLLTLVFLTLGITVESSLYFMIDSNSSLRQPSLYEQQCCNRNNVGKSFNFNENNILNFIICPDKIPASCNEVYKYNYTDCKEWFMNGNTTSGVYTIHPDKGTPFEVYCDMETDGGGSTVFQRRKDGSVDFYRNWTDYEEGFGDLNGEYWLGLSKIHRLTQDGTNYTLRVDLKDFENETRYAKYSTFNIGNSTTDYTITVGGYSGNAGDSMTTSGFAYINGMKFSTKDRDNDRWNGTCNCAVYSVGAWWYNACHRSNLNGPYIKEYNGNGIRWSAWQYYSLKFTEMKLQ